MGYKRSLFFLVYFAVNVYAMFFIFFMRYELMADRVEMLHKLNNGERFSRRTGGKYGLPKYAMVIHAEKIGYENFAE